MRNAIVAAAVSAVLSSAVWASDGDMGKFLGSWELDLGRTTAEIKRIAKEDRSQLDTAFGKMTVEDMLAQVKDLAAAMRYQITAKEVIGLMNGQKDATPYSVLSSKETSAVIVVNKGGRSVTNTLSLVDGKYMVESQSRGFVWKKAGEQPTEARK